MENLLTFGIAIFTLINPPGMISVFLSMTQEYNDKKQRKTAVGTFFAVLTIMILVTWAGDYILNFFGIRTDSLKVAGSIIIGMLGLSMIQEQKSDIKYSTNKSELDVLLDEKENPLEALPSVDVSIRNQQLAENEDDKDKDDDKDSIIVVPLSFPIIVGPGTISAIITATATLPSVMDRVYISIVCTLVALSLLITLIFAVPIGKVLGKSGLSILTKIMGMLLMAIAVEMFVSGALVLFPALA